MNVKLPYCLLILIISNFNLAICNSDKPHIIYIMVDDLGWANVEFHNSRQKTPNLNSLLSESLYLNNFYTYKFCSPTRSAFMSGRISYHVNELNKNTCSHDFGIPLNMTTLSEKLVIEGGYIAHQIGKWHLGFASIAHIPYGRNFSSSLGYICGGLEDHYTQIRSQSVNNTNCVGTDLWDTNKPAYGMNGTYGGYLYSERAQNIIKNYNNSDNNNKPLFMYLATQNNHSPYEVPKYYINKFNSSWYELQRNVSGMSNFEDELIGNVTKLLKIKNMWNNTLMIITSDNGGPSGTDDSAANNSPLRGGKYSNFEGGIRVIAIVSGGYLPLNRRGKKLNGTIHIADWYSTLCNIIGINPNDTRAKLSNLPSIDSINMWDFIIGNINSSPRNEFILSSGNDGGLIKNDYKILFGTQSPAFWTTLDYPNGTQGEPKSINCGTIQNGGCLFNIKNDWTEHNDLANLSQYSTIKEQMRTRFIELNNSTFNPNRGNPDSACCQQIIKNGGFWGPWLD